MREFIDAALGFPAVLFSFALVVVVGYWATLLAGGADLDTPQADPGSDGASVVGFADALAAVGLGGVPVTVVLSFLVALAWFVSLTGTVLFGSATSSVLGRVGCSFAVLAVAVVSAWLGTRLLVRPLRKVFSMGTTPSRDDFVGRMCVIRTGWVGPDFGQAEVTAGDGSSALVQVRQLRQIAGEDSLTAGASVVIYHYDAAAEVFWVSALDSAGGTRPGGPSIY